MPIDREKLTEEFIDFIGALNKKHDSLLWFTNSTPSKNQFIPRRHVWLGKYRDQPSYG